MPKKARVLVIDDGVQHAQIVATHLPELSLVMPYGADGPPALPDGPAALAYLEAHDADVDVVLLDVHFDVAAERLLPLGDGASLARTRRFQGVAILRALRERHPDLPVVLLTSLADLALVDADGELASQSMTYFLDREDLATLRIRINAALSERAKGPEDGELLWGADRAMQTLRHRLAVLARGGMPIIIEGETGTGKSFLAERFVHKNSGRAGPFVSIDLATVPQELIPAHLFGSTRGAYTGAVADRKGVFELAHGGTLFIDEIQNTPLDIQRQLLTVLQERRIRPLGATADIAIDVKVVVASNQPLTEAVAAGRFRQDLLMRLGPATRVEIPPLRERRADLAPLAKSFVERAGGHPDVAELKTQVARAAGVSAAAPLLLLLGREEAHARAVAAPPKADALYLVLPAPAWRVLERHTWPGNMRELAMLMHNLVVFTLVGAVDALRAGLPLDTARLQVDPGLVGELLRRPKSTRDPVAKKADGGLRLQVEVAPARTLNAVARGIERQLFTDLFARTGGDFAKMAELMLGDPAKARAIRLRLNQLGLRARELRPK